MKPHIRVLSLLAAAVLLTACSRGPLPASRQENLPGEAVPALEAVHIPARHVPHEPYNSTPPTSGPHLPHTAAAGVYREEIPEEIQVHVLEHGHVMIQYAPSTPAETVQWLEQFAHKYPRDVALAPYGKLESGIALTAWARLLRLEQPDEERMKEFVEALRGRYDHGWRR